MIVAHRGASKSERENTLAAFREAGRQGAAMVELDVRLSADSKMVVHHDPHVVTEAGTTWAINHLAAVDLPPHVPSLADALDACEGMQVNIEIKNDDSEPDFDPERRAAAMVVDLLRSRGDADRMLISSFDLATIDRIRELDPALRTGYLFVVPLPDAETLLADMTARGHVAIHPHRKAVTKAFVDAAHARGIAVNVWTVDKPEELRSLAALGVDALITNTPAEAIAALADSEGNEADNLA